jgi:hypothetical protein
MTTTMNGVTVKDAKAKGWGTLPCPCCGEAQATITLDLTDLEGLHCQDCDADLTLADIEAFIQRWQPVLAWVRAAQTFGKEPS